MEKPSPLLSSSLAAGSWESTLVCSPCPLSGPVWLQPVVSQAASNTIATFVFIGPESDHWLCLPLTNWLTHWLPFSKLDWCDPGMWRWQLKTCRSWYCCWCWWWEIVYSVIQLCVAMVQIWKVKFGHKVKFLFRLWAQGFKVWSRFWSWCSGKILKLKFGHYFAADAWLWLWSSILVEILNLCQDF